jgi:hypothetical protein
MGEWKYISTILDLGTTREWSASLSGRFIFEEVFSCAHWIEGWVGHRAGLDTVE